MTTPNSRCVAIADVSISQWRPKTSSIHLPLNNNILISWLRKDLTQLMITWRGLQFRGLLWLGPRAVPSTLRKRSSSPKAGSQDHASGFSPPSGSLLFPPLALACAVEPDTPAFTRQKCVDQGTSTLTQMHKAAIVWGDAKPDNILIDKNEDAWIIDFGGGYTGGFVEREKAGTIEGDLQGLEKIVDYVFRERAE